jgi:DNA modification methylase
LTPNVFDKRKIPDHLQKYFVRAEIGLEPTPEAYVSSMVEVFRECRRVLRDDGVLFLNLGDSYGNPSAGRDDGNHRADGRPGGMSYKAVGKQKHTGNTIKPKDLVGIPWRVAFALQADGWYLRQDIIWHKPNPMPESVTDRCTKAHEYIFLMSKNATYFYDAGAIAQPAAPSSVARCAQDIDAQAGSTRANGGGKKNGNMKAVGDGGLVNKRSVWTITTKPFSEAHFATFPPELPETCIKAGCPADGVVLDPFGGAGTTGLVADRLGRDAVLIELNPEYAEIARKRIEGDAPMFSTVEVAA